LSQLTLAAGVNILPVSHHRDLWRYDENFGIAIPILGKTTSSRAV
jgi:hypothetical protein